MTEPTTDPADRVTLNRDQLAGLLAHHADVLAARWYAAAPGAGAWEVAAALALRSHAQELTAEEETTPVAELLDDVMSFPSPLALVAGTDRRDCITVRPERAEYVLLCRPMAATREQDWTVVESWPEDERPQAAAALEHRRAGFPAIEYRLARATTVYTADGEQL